MSRDTIVWLSVVLFMVHEFEEIIFIRPWLSTRVRAGRRSGDSDHSARRRWPP